MVFLVIIIILLGHNFVSENNEQNVMENISLSLNFVSEIREMVGVVSTRDVSCVSVSCFDNMRALHDRLNSQFISLPIWAYYR